MREILFRGKGSDNRSWFYGWFCRYPFGSWPLKDAIIPSEEAENGYHRFVEVDGATVGQFTGLCDKNGKRIFEGDIVRCVSFGSERILIVVWDADEFDFKATNGETQYGSNFTYLGNCEEIEIMGNIHDNLKLLGVIENDRMDFR